MDFIKKRPVFLLLLVGITLRFLFIDQQTLWMDEASVHYEAFRKSFAHTWDYRHRLQPQNAPLFPLLISFLSGFFDDFSFITFRYFSAILGSLGLLAVYLFASSYLKDKKNSLLFLSVMVFSSFHIQFSQFVRFYILLFFLFYLHLYFSLKWFDKKDKKSLILIFLVSAIGCWTNQLMAMSFLIGSLIFINSYGFKIRPLILYNTMNVIGFLTYLPSYLLYVGGKFKIGSYRTVGLSDVAYMVKTVFFPKHLGLSLLELRFFNQNNFSVSEIINKLTSVVFSEIVLLILFCIPWFWLFCKFKKVSRDKFIFFSSLLLFCMYLFYKNVPFNDRYFLIFYPLFLILLLKNLDIFGRFKSIIFSFILLLNIYSVVNYFGNKRHHTLNVNNIINYLGSKNNYISLDSSRIFFGYFRKKLNGKHASVIENLTDREKYDSYLPQFFSKLDFATIVFTYRSLLGEKQLNTIFAKIKSTHIVSEPHKNIDPYFRVFKIIKR